MIINPSTEQLEKKFDSRFTLVNAIAKRARQIVDGEQCIVKSNSQNAITLAANEIIEDKIVYTKLK